MREIINKGIREEEILETIENVFDAGWKAVKLYFMIGLPGEEMEDIEAIVHLLKRAARIIPVRATVTPFVPKAWTPFAWSPMESKERLKAKGSLIKKGVSGKKRIKVVIESTRMAIIEAALARGDRLLGLRLAQGDIDEELLRSYAERRFTVDDHPPWEIIDPGCSREKLWKRWLSY